MEKEKYLAHKTHNIQLEDLGEVLDIDYLEFYPSRIFSYNNTVYAQILAYKDARVDMNILDNVVGCGLWQNEYKRDSKGILQCGIGIYVTSLSQWVWKWSNGMPSAFSKEKGEYSDALKRAGYLWGIGRSLYDFPKITIILNDKQWKGTFERPEATGYLKPNDWEWDIWIDKDKGEYEQIVITDRKGNILYNMNPHKKKFKDIDNKQNR